MDLETLNMRNWITDDGGILLSHIGLIMYLNQSFHKTKMKLRFNNTDTFS